MQLARLQIAFIGLIVVLSAAWLLSVPVGTFSDFWSLRGALVIYSGILAMGSMSAAVILAARPVQFEDVLGGLDKFYLLHRWLGIGAAIFGIAHWLFENAPRWMAQRGWLPPRVRPPPGPEPTGFDPFRDLRDLAGGLGEWAFYLLLVLVVLALWKRFPYRYFFMTHRLMAPVYLVLVFHAVIMMGPAYWSAPIGPIMAVLMAGATVAAVTSLFHRIGRAQRAVGTIESLTHYHDNAVLDVGVRLSTAWPGHRAGQFAFVDFGGGENAHPFTISSSWHRDGRLMFSIKGLGDYTRALPQQLFVGQTVRVEGPYGRFTFQGKRSRQIWVGGGIGITPFIARLQMLAEQPADAPVDLIYSTAAPAAAFIDNIQDLAEKARVRFHLVTPQDGLLTLDRLEAKIPDWQAADVWFCGPMGFGNALRAAMKAQGFDVSYFHQELFAMR